MSKIGFVLPHEENIPEVKEQVNEATFSDAEEIIKQQGFFKAMKHVQKFLNDTRPFVSDKDKMETCIEALQTIKIRYFEPIRD